MLSMPGAVLQTASASVPARLWTVALPEGTAGVALGVRGSENALACPQDSRCPSAALSRADTSMQPTAQT